jgi:hypothetical protein
MATTQDTQSTSQLTQSTTQIRMATARVDASTSQLTVSTSQLQQTTSQASISTSQLQQTTSQSLQTDTQVRKSTSQLKSCSASTEICTPVAIGSCTAGGDITCETTTSGPTLVASCDGRADQRRGLHPGGADLGQQLHDNELHDRGLAADRGCLVHGIAAQCRQRLHDDLVQHGHDRSDLDRDVHAHRRHGRK